jgi:ketosteroid isomerase-like protein
MDLKALIQEVNNCFEQNRMEEFYAHCSPTIKWEIVGHSMINGIDEMKNFSSQITKNPFKTIIKPNFIIAEGNIGISEGITQMIYENGKTMTMRYTDIYHFQDNLIREMTTYCIEPKEK